MSISRALRLGLLVAVSVSAAAWAAPRQAPVVTIRITDAGVVVSPQVVTVRAGEEVEWQSDYSFAIAVERNAALFGQPLPPQALRARAQGQNRAALRVRTGANAAEGAYKYSVGVWDGENVWVLDPEIVITPGR